MRESSPPSPLVDDLLSQLFGTKEFVLEAKKGIANMMRQGSGKNIEDCNPQTMRAFISFLREKDYRSPLALLITVADSDFFFKSPQEIKDSREIYEIVFKDKPGKDIIFAFLESLGASDIQEDITASLAPPSSPELPQGEMDSLHVVRILDQLGDIAEQEKDVISGIHTTRQELLEKLPALVIQEFMKQQMLQQKSKDMFLQESLEKRAAINRQSLEEYVGGLILLLGQKESLLDPEKDKELFVFLGMLKAWIHTL